MKRWFCGSCKTPLGKGSKTSPSLWCHVCGWVHFKCSGLENSKEYNNNFLCSKCDRSRILLSGETDRDYATSFTKIHESYTNPRSKAAFGSRRNLVTTSQCSSKNVDRYLNSSETYTKFKLTRKRFLRLKVVSYRLNEIWSVDAYGYMRSFEEIGPGYVYFLTKAQSFHNNMLLGHFSGISYWLFVKLFHREQFNAFPFQQSFVV